MKETGYPDFLVDHCTEKTVKSFWPHTTQGLWPHIQSAAKCPAAVRAKLPQRYSYAGVFLALVYAGRKATAKRTILKQLCGKNYRRDNRCAGVWKAVAWLCVKSQHTNISAVVLPAQLLKAVAVFCRNFRRNSAKKVAALLCIVFSAWKISCGHNNSKRYK